MKTIPESTIAPSAPDQLDLGSSAPQATAPQAASASQSKVAYSAPQLSIHGQIERTTQTTSPVGPGGGDEPGDIPEIP